MTDPFFRAVDPVLARNPVARAVARRRVVSAVTDFLLVVYTMPNGSVQADNVHAAARVIAVALRVIDLAGGEGQPVMRGTMSALVQCAARGFVWRQSDAPAVDAGLSRALEVVKSADPVVLQRAWSFVLGLEQKASLPTEG